MEKRFFFVTDRKVKNLEPRRDVFFDFDQYQIFRNLEIKHLVFKFGPKN